MTTKDDCVHAIEVLYDQIAVVQDFFNASMKNTKCSDLFCLKSMVDNIKLLLESEQRFV